MTARKLRGKSVKQGGIWKNVKEIYYAVALHCNGCKLCINQPLLLAMVGFFFFSYSVYSFSTEEKNSSKVENNTGCWCEKPHCHSEPKPSPNAPRYNKHDCWQICQCKKQNKTVANKKTEKG